MIENLRNIAIIAHVDHGKTTLVDKLLQQSGTLNTRGPEVERVMDSNDIEKERGITILSKNTALKWNDYHINIVDTPGHADFGGEVERVLSMVDSVLLLVDAVDGPMPQTRFVTEKAFAQGLKPIVVINKIDRDGARPDWVVDQVFDLFDRLGATDEQLDFPIIYASAINGWATKELGVEKEDMNDLFHAIVDNVSAPDVDENGAFQMQISSLDYSNFLGTIGIGRIQRGKVKTNTPITLINKDGKTRNGRILQVLGYMGLDRVEVPEAQAGDIVCITGMEGLNISDTLCSPDKVEALPELSVDEPTISMTFQVNNSPFAGKEGKFVTSRQIKDRLDKELLTNVALRVEQLDDADKFKVSGRGELHLSILLENMRREGFEIAVSRPHVIFKEVDGVMHEPFEQAIIDVDDTFQGVVMERMGLRQGELKNMEPDGKGRVKLEFIIPSRGLIGFYTEFLTITSGSGIMNKIFDHYGPVKKQVLETRQNGTLISINTGKAVAFSIFNLQERGKMFVTHNTEVYEGMIIGIHNRDNDLTVNCTKGKQLTNMRASGKDEAVALVTPINLTLEYALEFIEDDELVEITPENIRLRKKHLTESGRKKAGRGG
ncbi:translational GTPase TypA [Francisella sp. Scap27]|uniref:translational GTPase TypA n=1 Tax=Francisella sp. Scap27 TaxID=2589986 RepID=UPI0015B873F0|nr:translational GTPase TypA [Francisella sp. Scap27]QLE78589.1 translational GTPase TypA [Francisella sp. Scap27]